MNSGYKGRKGVYELLIPNDEIHQMILDQCSSENIRSVAMQAGMKTLHQVCIELVVKGETTPEELIRITREH